MPRKLLPIAAKGKRLRAARFPGSVAGMVTLYGIRNCDTVKKARAWLEARGVAYDFHDYKTVGIDAPRLRGWARELGWEKLLNRAGTTFRALPGADKADLDEDKAIALMLAHPSMIKRPVLDLGDKRLLGFSDSLYGDTL
jgi:arsenate reductase